MSITNTQDIKTDEDFEKMIPPLTEEEFLQLEKNLIEDGCREPLVVWNGILIDGHNRYKICKKNSIAFSISEKSFQNREKVEEWIDKNQLGRRNLKSDQVSLIRGRYYNRIKKQNNDLLKKEPPEKKTEKKMLSISIELAKKHGVSNATIKRDGLYATAVERVKIIEPKIEYQVLGGKAPSRAKIMKAAILSNESPENAKALLEGEKSLKEIKQEEQEHARNLNPLPKEKFDVLYANISAVHQNSERILKAIKDICDLRIKEIAKENAVLFLRTSNTLLEKVLKVCNAWGFKYEANIVWLEEKMSKKYTCYAGFEHQHELLLICTKGKMEPQNKRASSVIEQKENETLQTVYQVIEHLYPNLNYIQLLDKTAVALENWKTWDVE